MKRQPPTRWQLGFTADRRWTEWDRLERDPLLLSRLGPAGAALVACGVRELLSNVERHGAPGSDHAELSLEPEARSLRLVIPANEFDSVARGHEPGRGFLSRFSAMLAEDGIAWSHRFEGGRNHLEFSLAGARIWVEIEEQDDEQ